MHVLDKNYWNNRYLQNETGWDLGAVSPPLKAIFDTLANKDAAILIPGCGNAHEAAYLAAQGFSNITLLDIAPAVVESLTAKFQHIPAINIICQDFFEHQQQYDYIIEQTFFCALPIDLRTKYVAKMATLLLPNGKITGVLFNRNFELEGPPFGGNIQEYEALFKNHLKTHFWNSENSIPGRAGNEVCFEGVLQPPLLG